MRLPFVSRARYELLEHNFGEMRLEFGERVLFAERLSHRVSAAYDALLEKYHALKLQGAVIPAPQPPIGPPIQHDEVTRRINILSVGKPGLRAQMLKQVANDRLFGGLDDVAIMQRIEAGVTSDDGVIA